LVEGKSLHLDTRTEPRSHILKPFPELVVRGRMLYSDLSFSIERERKKQREKDT